MINYIRAGYPGLYLVSPEEARVEAELKSIAQELEFNLHVWNVTAGLLDTAKGAVRQCNVVAMRTPGSLKSQLPGSTSNCSPGASTFSNTLP